MPKNYLMGEFKTRILPIFRRSSGSSARSNTDSSVHSAVNLPKSRSKASLISKFNKSSGSSEPTLREQSAPHALSLPSPQLPDVLHPIDHRQSFERPPTPPRSSLSHGNEEQPENPRLAIIEATPDQGNALESSIDPLTIPELDSQPEESAALKGQSLAPNSQHPFRKNLVGANSGLPTQVEPQDYFGRAPVLSLNMLHRKIWVKRPGASATLVQINEDDLVDDARDKVLRKYINSLGRTFDSPDVTLRIIPRENAQYKQGSTERSLGPEEPITHTLDAYFPGGQTVNEALIIDIPHRRTPRHSPRIYSDNRPSEAGADYFPVMNVAMNHSPHLPSNVSIAGSTGSNQQIHTISVLNTGHVPALPSPGGTVRPARHGTHRPKFPRTNTSSPTVLSSTASHADVRQIGPPTPSLPALSTPPLTTSAVPQQKVSTPPPRISSPRPSKTSRIRRSKKASVSQAALPNSLLDGGVPPINVLIVEDNIINLKLLEAFMKRLKVRWHTAMNGRDAVTKWRAGGFHLVLMDIQLPVMNGLDATKEIRRLERVNGIGVLADKVGDRPSAGGRADGAKAEGNDRLENQESFKSPVIIVALTASSLQSDRHEALAAGCNDFLTKPVNFVWLERKVMEWGCMQALIDFDGWRKWKDFSVNSPATGKKAPDGPLSLKAAQAASPNSMLPIKTRESASNSNSTGSSDASAQPTVIPDTLMALNAKSESADTLDSVSTTGSGDSLETTTPLPTSSATALTPHGNFHRQAPSQVKLHAQPHPHNLRPVATDTNLVTVKQHSHSKSSGPMKEDRRRKRSSLGHSGLSGVVEEWEDGKEYQHKGFRSRELEQGASIS